MTRFDVIRHRLAVFAKETAPLIDYYRGRGILLEVSTDRPEAEVQADLLEQLHARGLLLPAAGESAPDHAAPAGAMPPGTGEPPRYDEPARPILS